MINVSKAVIEDSGKYLLIKRSSTSKFFSSKWDFPGGKVKEGESFEKSLIREVHEETTMKVEIGELLFEGKIEENFSEINQKVFSIVNFKGEVILSLDHTDFKWLNKEEMLKFGITPFVKLFKSRL